LECTPGDLPFPGSFPQVIFRLKARAIIGIGNPGMPERERGKCGPRSGVSGWH
jgi:hypothetical protein